MKVKKNLSEELVINDDISLGSLNCDEEECKKELEKEIEDHEKEVNKELADKVKDVEEINEFEADPIEIHDGEDKKVKIKGLTEKLTLEEPDDVLNEDWEDWSEDDYFERYSNAVHKVYDVLLGFIRECRDYMHEAGENQLDAAESICDEALYHLEDLKDEFGDITEDVQPTYYSSADAYNDAVSEMIDVVRRLMSRVRDIPKEDAIQLCNNVFDEAIRDSLDENLEEEVLDEKIPKDLAKAYKGAGNYKGRSGSNTDLENSTYDVIDDPDKAYKLYKQDPRSVRLLFNGQLIDFRDDGRPSDTHRDQWLDSDKVFTNRNGKIVRDTMYIPPKELFRRADKIYITNEHTPEGMKDREKLAARSENPESPHSTVGNNLNDYTFGGGRWRWNSDRRRGSAGNGSDSSILNYIKRDERYLKELKNELARADETGEYGWRGRDGYLERIKEYEASIAKKKNDLRDNRARRRYANSEIALQKPIERFMDLRNNVSNLRSNVESAEQNLNNVKVNGSRSSRENKQRLKDLLDEIKSLQRKVAMVELNLEETDEEDAKAVAEADRKYQAALAEYNAAQSEIDNLLRRNR